MIGSEIRPMAMTEAATTPVVAARSAPTKMTAKARPPRTGPKSWPIVSRRSSAMPDRSRIRPMKVKNGMARSVSLLSTPKKRSGRAPRSGQERVIWPPEIGASSTPMTKNRRPLAASAKATGYPSSRKITSDANMIGARLCATNSITAASPPHRRHARASSAPRLRDVRDGPAPALQGRRSGPRRA